MDEYVHYENESHWPARRDAKQQKSLFQDETDIWPCRTETTVSARWDETSRYAHQEQLSEPGQANTLIEF